MPCSMGNVVGNDIHGRLMAKQEQQLAKRSGGGPLRRMASESRKLLRKLSLQGGLPISGDGEEVSKSPGQLLGPKLWQAAVQGGWVESGQRPCKPLLLGSPLEASSSDMKKVRGC